MAEIRTDQLLLPSVLDRLIDHDPGVSQEPARGRNQLLRDLKLAVRRDLENLLNTRIRCIPLPAELKELRQSMVNYGIPDLTKASPRLGQGAARWSSGADEVVITLYEPRLKKLRVSSARTGRFGRPHDPLPHRGGAPGRAGARAGRLRLHAPADHRLLRGEGGIRWPMSCWSSTTGN
ncbi:MAG: type VI secretion system baseplate subunit TssE [Isosphaeraceae bacterium]